MISMPPHTRWATCGCDPRPRHPEAALERRETRECHNNSDYLELDESLQVNLVWSPSMGVTREDISPILAEIAALMREVSVASKLVE